MTRPFCIYAITHTASGRRYVGSSVNHRSRWFTHKSFLKNNKHHCIGLQKAWNKYGDGAFHYEVLENREGTDVERFEVELKWIRSSKRCFNSRRAHTLLNNFVNSPATCLMISAGLRRRWSDPSVRNSHGIKMKQIWADPERRAVYVSFIRAIRRSPQGRQATSAWMQAAWDDPNSSHRKRRPPRITKEISASKAEKMRVYWASPEGLKVKARRSNKLRAYWRDPNSAMRNRGLGARTPQIC